VYTQLIAISFAVTTARVTVRSGIVIHTKMDNTPRNIEKAVTTCLYAHGYTTSQKLVSDGDSQRLQTTFLKYYDPSDIDVEDYDLLEALTNDSISVEDSKLMVHNFVFKAEKATGRQEIKPGNIWSVDLLSPKDPVNAKAIRLPVHKFLVIIDFYKDCSEALNICHQLGGPV